MADGTNIHEPVNGSLVETPIDTFEVSFGGVLRDRQRVALAGKTSASDVAVVNTAPAASSWGIVTRPILPASFDVTVLNQTAPLTNTELRSSPVAVSGAVTVGNFPAGMATEATLVSVRDRPDFPLPPAQITALKSVTITNPTANPETGLAKDTTLAAVRDRASFPLPAAQVTDLKTVTVANPTAAPETGLAKDATLTSGVQKTQVTNLPATQTVAGTVAVSNFPAAPPAQLDALTDTELRAAPVPVDTGLSIPQPQTDALTNTQLRATPVPVSTGLTTQTDALTDAQLRAAPVPVSTGLTIPQPQTDALTDTQLRAAPVSVSGVASLVAGASRIGYVDPGFLLAVESGAAFITGSRVTLSSGQSAAYALSNPAGSGYYVQIVSFSLFTDQPGRVRYRDDVNVGAGATLVSSMPLFQQTNPPPSPATGWSGLVTNFTGGSYLPIESRAYANAPVAVELPILLSPGHSFTMEVTAPSGLGATMDSAANCVYAVRPV